MSKFKNKATIITGASRGMGAVIAKLYGVIYQYMAIYNEYFLETIRSGFKGIHTYNTTNQTLYSCNTLINFAILNLESATGTDRRGNQQSEIKKQ